MSERQAKRENKRTPINGRRGKLNVKGKDPAYEYRVVNNIDDRVEDFLAAGYELVKNDGTHKVGDKRVATPGSLDSNVEFSVGGGDKAILMRIKKEWYDEDQKAKQRGIDELESTIRNPNTEGIHGKVEIS